MAPGAFDALSAKVVEAAGFSALYMGGLGASASLLGAPDLGLLTLTEMAGQAARLSAAVRIPLIADADTGYGGPLNVMRAVREFERAGVAALHLEDQTVPKRCGHLEGVKVVSLEEMRGRIRAALDARADESLIIIGRTDAAATLGLDEALRRGEAFLEDGADMVFIESLKTREDFQRVSRELQAPLMANIMEDGSGPLLSFGELKDFGYRLVIFPVFLLYGALRAMRELAAGLKERGESGPFLERLAGPEELDRLLGLQEAQALEKRFAPGGGPAENLD